MHNNTKLVKKIAYTKDNHKIGKIIGIIGNPKTVFYIKKPHIIVRNKTFLKGKTLIQLGFNLITKIEKKKVWINITRNEFERLKNVKQVDENKRGIKAKAMLVDEQINRQAELQERVKQLHLKQFF